MDFFYGIQPVYSACSFSAKTKDAVLFESSGAGATKAILNGVQKSLKQPPALSVNSCSARDSFGGCNDAMNEIFELYFKPLYLFNKIY